MTTLGWIIVFGLAMVVWSLLARAFGWSKRVADWGLILIFFVVGIYVTWRQTRQ